MNDFLADFFVMQDWKLASARRWVVEDFGHPLYRELCDEAGGPGQLLATHAAGDYPAGLRDRFCLHCGLTRDLYDPLDPYGKRPYEVWTIKWLGEFLDWYVAKFVATGVAVARGDSPDEVAADESADEPVRRKPGRPRKRPADAQEASN